MSDIHVLTFGCRLNAYESEVMRDHAKNAGLKDTIIVNTCAVTNAAERDARQAIRRARRKNPSAKIIVTGCAAQINPQSFAQMPEVDQVIGNDIKLQAQTWGAPSSEKIIVNDIMAVKETAAHLIEGLEGHARAFIQVQNGCDHRCTFCIIPYGRGNSRSVPVGVIADQVRKLVQSGYNEVVMSGVDVTSYGKDLPGLPTLGQMIRRVLALVPELKRLRLSSLDPVEIDDDLWRLIETEERLMPHLHMSLQAGDDMILKRMKRRHLRADAINMCSRARKARPDIVFGADIIAGFPTETDEMFNNTLRIIEECDLTWLHIFPYSPRPGTPAAKMPQLESAIIKARAAILREKGEAQVRAFMRNCVGQSFEVIIERNNIGRTPQFAAVKVPMTYPVGSLQNIIVSDFVENTLLAKAA